MTSVDTSTIASKCIDLTFPFDSNSSFWPNGQGFCLCLTTSNSSGYFYSSGTFTCSEHCGTHVDAPYHFCEDGITVDQIPIRSLIAKCCVIDIQDKCNIPDGSGDSYVLSPSDIEAYETQYGIINSGEIVIVRTGWSKRYYDGPSVYLGFDEAKQGAYDSRSSILTFPGVGNEAAKLFVDRQIAALGIDTGQWCFPLRLRSFVSNFGDVSSCVLLASMDPGRDKSFATHRELLGAGVYGIENIHHDVSLLPPRGATLFVMPMKIAGGTGGPARVFAVLP